MLAIELPVAGEDKALLVLLALPVELPLIVLVSALELTELPVELMVAAEEWLVDDAAVEEEGAEETVFVESSVNWPE